MSAIVAQLNQIVARWHHGHAELTNGCALCNAEFAEVYQAIHDEPAGTGEES